MQFISLLVKNSANQMKRMNECGFFCFFFLSFFFANFDVCMYYFLRCDTISGSFSAARYEDMKVNHAM